MLRFMWEDKITTNMKEIDGNVGNWIDLAQGQECLENPCDYKIELPGSTSHGVSYCFSIVSLKRLTAYCTVSPWKPVVQDVSR